MGLASVTFTLRTASALGAATIRCRERGRAGDGYSSARNAPGKSSHLSDSSTCLTLRIVLKILRGSVARSSSQALHSVPQMGFEHLPFARVHANNRGCKEEKDTISCLYEAYMRQAKWCMFAEI